MTAQWLAFQSFQRNQRLLKAINTLCLHLMQENQSQAPDVGLAIDELEQFLDHLAKAIAQIKGRGVVYGVDPRLQQFVRSYLSAARFAHLDSPWFNETVEEVKQRLKQVETQEPQEVLAYLEGLRLLVEQHIEDDARQVLGVR